MRSIATIAVTFRQYVKVKNNEINILRRKVRALESKVIKQEKQIGKQIKKKSIVPHYEPVPTPPLSSDSEVDSLTFARAPISCDVVDRAFSLEPGQVSEPFAAGEGWNIVALMFKRDKV